jgi:hypothetical protein
VKHESKAKTESPEIERMCIVRLDRFAFVCPRDGFNSKGFRKPPKVPGFKTVDHKFVRRKAKIATWRQVLFLENPKTGTKLRIQYDRAHGFLKPMKSTVISKDLPGLLWPEIKAIGDTFSDFEISMVEIAFDFHPGSGVDKTFVAKHARFGKSHRVPMQQYPGSLRYGGRPSAKLVRCYWKEEVQAFRVELELHSRWLGLPQTDYLLYLLNVTERDFRFVRVDWAALDLYLNKKGARGKQIAAEARIRYTSLHRLLRYLRTAGVNNPHIFLRTMRKDKLIRRAIDAWSLSLSPRVRNRKEKNEEENEEEQVFTVEQFTEAQKLEEDEQERENYE